jgi:hypothetical protein
MVAFAATYDKDGNEKTKIHVFYGQQNKNLGLLFRNESGKAPISASQFASGEDACDGNILNPSYLAVTKFNNQDFVFGVTEKRSVSVNQNNNSLDPNDCKCPPGAKPVDLSIVSPVYAVVSPSVYSDNYKITACSDSEDNWIYYLKKKGEKLNLFEATIGNASDNEYPTLTNPIKNSALAAWYGPVDSLRHIVYQSDDNTLYEFTTNPTSNTQLSAAMGVKPNTSFAVAVTDDGIFLYYINSSNMISRVSKPLTKGAQFDNCHTVDSCTNQAGQDSQLTVTAVENAIHIFYEAVGQSKRNIVSHFVDKPRKPE